MGIERGDGPGGLGKTAPIILVVEDEVLVRMLACDILEDAGYGALEAVNAAEALVLIDARPDIALIFTDVDMPGEINGLGLARLIGLRAPDLPILITSGAAAVAASDLPPRGRFMRKPYSPSTLMEFVAEMTGVQPRS